MEPRIILVRHGPSAHVHSAGAIDRAGMERWRDAYDAAGIQIDSQPPTPLVHAAAEARYVIASDLQRAIRSAERLAPQRQIRVSALFRETPLPIPRWPTRLPFGGWATLITIGWSYRIVRGIDAAELELARARAAAEWLAGILSDGSTAVVVTHGAFRRLLARQLLIAGWRSTGRYGGYRHWSSWHFAGPVHIGQERGVDVGISPEPLTLPP